MAIDPRLNLINFNSIFNASAQKQNPTDNCAQTRSQNLQSSSDLLSFNGLIRAANAVGEFQLLPKGGGSVASGLASLVAVSDQVRLGGPPTASNSYGIPTTEQGGIDYVLNKVGLSNQTLAGVASINGLVSNAATLTASSVYNHVSKGTFTIGELQQSFSAFQNAVQLSQVVYNAASSIYPKNSKFATECGAKQYALDLINLAPKYKFLFVIQFEFDPAFEQILSGIDPAFVIKSSSRPNIQFEYDEVNMYNFRTKVPKRTSYQPINMKFYDDDYNNIFQFYNAYLKLMSPIANVNVEDVKLDPLDAYQIVGGGMGFDSSTQVIQPAWGGVLGHNYAGSLGTYGTDPSTRNILRAIRIFHVYKQGRMMNVYNFYNPKITEMTLDDLDMTTTGDGNEVALTFSYDSVYIVPGYRMNDATGRYDLPSLQPQAKLPFGISPGSISDDGDPRDGNGLEYGQRIENTNTGITPVVIANPVIDPLSPTLSPDLTSLSGSTLSALDSPDIADGGQDTQSNVSAASSGVVTNMQSQNPYSILDPVTNGTQNSANNIGDLGSVLGNTNANLAQQLNANNATAATNVVEQAAIDNANATAVKTASAQSVGTISTFKGQ